MTAQSTTRAPRAPSEVPTRFPVFAWATLAYALLVVLWGYFLRVSESGDGCGTDWPLCEGAFVPATSEFPTWVEFVHRISSGGVLVLMVVMAVWAIRAYPRGHAVRTAAFASVLFTVTESLFGAVLVVFGWVAGDVSVGRVLIRPIHVVNTFTLMAALGLTAWWSTRGTSRLPSLRHPGSRLFLPAILSVLALASVGSWTGLAGTAFPVTTVGEGLAQYLRPEHLLIYLRTVHPLVALVAVVVLGRAVLYAFRSASGAPDTPGQPGKPDALTRGLAVGVAAAAGLELVVGPLTIALLHPVWLRLLHLLLADLLWLGLLFLASEVLTRNARPAEKASYS